MGTTGSRICRYRVEYPATAGQYDRVRVTASSVSNVEVYAAVAQSYPGPDIEQMLLEPDRAIQV